MEWAEALAYMRGRVRKVKHMMTPEAAHTLRKLGLTIGRLTPEAIERIKADDWGDLPALGPPEVSERAWHLLDAGDPIAFDAIQNAIAMRLRRGANLSDREKIFAAEFLEGAKRPAKRGKYSYVGSWRAQGVRRLVKEANALGFPVYRNEATRGGSACDLVAEALKAEGMTPSSYSRVKGILSE